MKSSLPNTPLAAFSLLLLFSLSLPSAVSAGGYDTVTYHGGPLLTGNVSLAVLWYGKFESEKKVIKTFIESLGARSLSYEPDVACWWEKVESYSEVAKVNGGGAVSVRIAREVDDKNMSAGKELHGENLPAVIEKAAAGLANSIAVVFASKNVTITGTCDDTCYLHGIQGKQLYIVVGNPEETCPGVCALPFHYPDSWVAPLAAMTLEPPNGDIGVDSMVIQFASALVETVTNPFHNGFFAGKDETVEKDVAAPCKDIFGPKAFPGYPGNVRVDSMTGGAFNAHGNYNYKFLLPAIVDPETGSSCWTTLSS